MNIGDKPLRRPTWTIVTGARSRHSGRGLDYPATLPNPRAWSAARPSSFVRRQVERIDTRIGQLGPLLDCARVGG